MRKIFLIAIFHLVYVAGNAQQFMEVIEDSEVAQLLNLPAVVTLNDSSKIVGTVTKIYLSKGQLTNVSLKMQDGSTRKFKPVDIEVLKVRCVKPTMFTVVDSVGRAIKKVIYTQFVFEHPFRSANKTKPEMRQLLNPVFDSKIKIFQDPNASQSRSISIKGEPLPSNQTISYILIKGNEILSVKENQYVEDFARLFGDCPAMIKVVPSDQITFEGVAGHVLLYDHYCGQKK